MFSLVPSIGEEYTSLAFVPPHGAGQPCTGEATITPVTEGGGRVMAAALLRMIGACCASRGRHADAGGTTSGSPWDGEHVGGAGGREGQTAGKRAKRGFQGSPRAAYWCQQISGKALPVSSIEARSVRSHAVTSRLKSLL